MNKLILQVKRRDQRGFTLPELLTVIAIVGILAAIAVPTFLGSKRNSQDAKAKSNLRSALSAERTYYVDFQQYTVDDAALSRIEPQLGFTTTDAEAQGVMAMVLGPNPPQAVVLVSTSMSGNQFCIMNIAADLPGAINGQTLAGTYYGRNPATVATPPTAVTGLECGSAYEATEDGWNAS